MCEALRSTRRPKALLIHMVTFTLVLAAIAAVASLAALIGVWQVRSEMKKLRPRHSTEKLYWDERLGVATSRPEELRRYRDSIAVSGNDLPKDPYDANASVTVIHH